MGVFEDEQPLSVRAGEYVLGTLDARQTQAFEAELAHGTNRAEAQSELVYWEQRLGAIGSALAPVDPPGEVWMRIAAELDRDRPQGHTRVVAPASGGRFWPGLALAACAAALVLAAMLFVLSTSSPGDNNSSQYEPAYASVIQDEPTGMSWLVTAQKGSRKLSVLAMGDYDVPAGKMLRLWLKPEGHDPVLLGQWPHSSGSHVLDVPGTAAKFLDQRAQLVVSMEDVENAGKPTPDGRIMWASPLARRAG